MPNRGGEWPQLSRAIDRANCNCVLTRHLQKTRKRGESPAARAHRSDGIDCQNRSTMPRNHRTRVRAVARIAALLVGCLSILTAGAAFSVAATPAQDAAVRDAHAAWQDRDAARLDAASALLRTHVLAPYAQYWKLKLAPNDREIQQFMDRHAGSFLAERLAKDWVRGLGRRGDWSLIARVHAAIALPDSDVTCWALRARWAQGDRGVGDELMRGAWMQWRDLPKGCAMLGGELVAAGQLASGAVWARARHLVALGEPTAARRTLALLPGTQAPTPRQLDLAIGAPERWLDRGEADEFVARELSALAIAQVAIADPLRATRLLRQHDERLDAATRSYVHAQLGLQVARRLSDEAPSWFALARAADMTDEHRAWWARSALRSQRWADVRAAIEGMSDEGRSESRWQYWLARACNTLGDTVAAQALWRQAASEHGFYGRLSQEALGAPLGASPLPAPTRADVDAVARDAGIARAVALQRAGLRDEARGEWQWAVRKFDDRLLAAAASYAQRLGAWNRSLDSAERMSPLVHRTLRYPTPFRELVRPAARQFGVEEALVYGVMQQESRFAPEASSVVGARGLMQIMPSTAQWLASELGWPSFEGAWLDQPQRNITMGTRYLRQLRGDLRGSEVLAAAAYNAGPGRAVAWLGGREMEGAIYAESIPFDETREYVKRVLNASVHYAEVLNRAPQQLTSRLGQVPVGNTSTQTVSTGTATAMARNNGARTAAATRMR